MTAEKLDSVVCNALTGQGLPPHFYLKFLNFGVNCIRELNMDVMRNVVTEKLEVNSYGAAQIPCNCLDWVEVGVPVGQYIKPMSQKNEISPLKNFDEDGKPIPYPVINREMLRGYSNLEYPYYRAGYVYILNSKGENKGGIFGWGGGNYRYSFKFIKERNEIQTDAGFCGKEIVLKYITDGLDTCGCDTMINPYAYDTIKNYMIWQFYLNSKQLVKLAPMWERQYDIAFKKLRGRMNPLTVHDILAALRKNYKAVIKN